MLDLAEQGRICGIEAKLDGTRGIADLHDTIREAETLMVRNEKRHSLAVVDRLLAQGEALVL